MLIHFPNFTKVCVLTIRIKIPSVYAVIRCKKLMLSDYDKNFVYKYHKMHKNAAIALTRNKHCEQPEDMNSAIKLRWLARIIKEYLQTIFSFLVGDIK